MTHGHHLDLAGHRAVEGGDDAGKPLQIRGVIGDDQRIVVGVGDDGVVRCNQRAQHRHQIARRLISQPKDLGDDLLTARRWTAPGIDRPRLQLGVGLGHHPRDRPGLDDGKTLQSQRRLQQFVGGLRGHRTRGLEGDLAAHTRIDNEGPVQQMTEGTDHRVDIGILEIERDRLRTAGLDIGRRHHAGTRGDRPDAQDGEREQSHHDVRDAAQCQTLLLNTNQSGSNLDDGPLAFAATQQSKQRRKSSPLRFIGLRFRGKTQTRTRIPDPAAIKSQRT